MNIHNSPVGMNYAICKESMKGGSSLRNAYIKFQTPEDRALGCAELTAHSPVSCLTGDIFCVPWNSLSLLEDSHVAYAFATQDDLTDAHPIWKFAAGAGR
jgi:hypothetical protein